MLDEALADSKGFSLAVAKAMPEADYMPIPLKERSRFSRSDFRE